jgi:hypothetical protein
LPSRRAPEELIGKVKAKYPKLGLDTILKIGAVAAFGQKL